LNPAASAGSPGMEEPASTLWLRQGDVFTTITSIPTLGPAGRCAEKETPHGVVVLSQTCDAVRSETVQVAPIVHLSGPDVHVAASGRTPKYAPLPGIGGEVFAQLQIVATIAKSLLSSDARRPGVLTPKDTRSFAMAVGRRFSRFAFPDDVASWFQPLQRLAQNKAHHHQSPEGRVFANVRQIRVRSDSGWLATPYDLTISFLLDEGEMPFGAGDDLPDVPLELEHWLSGKTALQIAQRLLDNGGSADSYHLWGALAAEWVGRCARVFEPGSTCVSSYTVEVAGLDEYSLAAYFDSESLDLDHLSGPTLA